MVREFAYNKIITTMAILFLTSLINCVATKNNIQPKIGIIENFNYCKYIDSLLINNSMLNAQEPSLKFWDRQTVYLLDKYDGAMHQLSSEQSLEYKNLIRTKDSLQTLGQRVVLINRDLRAYWTANRTRSQMDSCRTYSRLLSTCAIKARLLFLDSIGCSEKELRKNNTQSYNQLEERISIQIYSNNLTTCIAESLNKIR
jgi:hypothetical protein